MWLFLPTSFLSIVVYQGDHPDPRLLLVRARLTGDIERVFPAATVLHTPEHDYAYRATLPRTKVAAAIAAAVKAIDYPNFKNAVSEIGFSRTLRAVWPLYLGSESGKRWIHVHGGPPRAVSLAVHRAQRARNQPRTADTRPCHHRGRVAPERGGLPRLRPTFSTSP